MQNKVSVNTNIGMSRDRSISKPDNQLAFENHNIRITARDKDTLLSVTNERGNTPIVFSSSSDAQSSDYTGLFATEIVGTLLGYAVLNNYLVLFTTAAGTDYIYRIEYKNALNEWYLRLLYRGSLGFSVYNPIETISLFETEDVQKVYWVDGKNQPRVINIKKSYFTIVNSEPVFFKNTIFDFVTDYNHSGFNKLSVTITKQQLGMGSFPAGTIQYLCTYFNKYGQETNPVYVSPIYYISPDDRGGDAETTYTCSFKVSLSNADSDFDYVRIYAILRTSESGTPISYIAGTINIKTETLSIIDTGQGDNVVIDPTILLYIGGREISAGTFSHKDNTLFLGDIQFTGSKNDVQIERAISESFMFDTETYISNNVSFFLSNSASLNAPYYSNDGLYPYKSQLNSSSDKITGFKGGEKYRFAIQFVTATGQKSRAFFIGDAENPYYPMIDTATNTIKRPLPRVNLPDRVVSSATAAGYVEVILLMAEASDGDRSVVAQGIISPTVFNLGQRSNNAPYAISSWYMRPRNSQINSRHFESVNNISTITYDSEDTSKVKSANVTFCEIQNITPEKTPYYNEDSFDTSMIKVAHVTTVTSLQNQAVTLRLYAIFLFSDGQQAVWRVSNDENSDAISFDFPTSGDPTAQHYNNLLSLQPKYSGGGRLSKLESVYKAYKEAFLSNVVKDETLVPSSNDIMENIDLSGRQVTNAINRIANLDIQGGASKTRYARDNSEQYYVDENIVTLNTPDIDKLQSSDLSGLKLRIIGIAEVTSNISDYTIQTTTGRSPSASVYRTDFNHVGSENIEGIVTYPLLYDVSPVDSAGKPLEPQEKETSSLSEVGGVPAYFDIYPFHKEGSIICGSALKEEYSRIEKKTYANLRYCYNTKYLWTGSRTWTPQSNVAITATTGDQSAQFKQLRLGTDSYIYQGTYDYLSTTGTKEYSIFGVSPDTDMSESSIRGTVDKAITSTSEAVRIQFQSLPHAVIKFGKVNGKNEILPILSNEQAITFPEGYYLPWNDVLGVSHWSITVSAS